jgi:hypothetical protein
MQQDDPMHDDDQCPNVVEPNSDVEIVSMHSLTHFHQT